MVTGKFVKVFCFSVDCRLPELVIVFLLLFLSYNVVQNSAFHYKHEIQNKTDNLPKCFGGVFSSSFPQKKSYTHTHHFVYN